MHGRVLAITAVIGAAALLVSLNARETSPPAGDRQTLGGMAPTLPDAPPERSAVVVKAAPQSALPSDTEFAFVDPSDMQERIEIGEARAVDETPWDSPAEIIELGELYDADDSMAWAFDAFEQEPIDLGEVLDADDPSASDARDNQPESIDLGELRDADAPWQDVDSTQAPLDLGSPMEAALVPRF